MKSNDWYMPAEWEEHKGTILVWPSNIETWGETINNVQSSIIELMKVISEFEKVFVTVKDAQTKYLLNNTIKSERIKNVSVLEITNNDSWVRDFGPNFVLNRKDKSKPAINNWRYNAWGGKYPPWEDDLIYTNKFAEISGYKDIFDIDMILEGGSIDVNGEGIVLTTKSCLLNKNRNPEMTMSEIEANLKKYLGVNEIIWIDEGIAGDDTDGHIDDFMRFVDKNNIVCCYEENKNDENYHVLDKAYNELINNSVIKESEIKVHKIPMPSPKYYKEIRIPASYANFYFVNGGLVVPVFDDTKDLEVLDFIQSLRPDLKVVGVNGIDFVVGLGGIHCLTQQVY
ncbi:MAG: hypothetical protein ACD_79C01014G0009 [uncultured bacterium]|nr:MAG: hypothetical protein ACD_79C01014G0009 [uncultured bacterium]